MSVFFLILYRILEHLKALRVLRNEKNKGTCQSFCLNLLLFQLLSSPTVLERIAGNKRFIKNKNNKNSLRTKKNI